MSLLDISWVFLVSRSPKKRCECELQGLYLKCLWFGQAFKKPKENEVVMFMKDLVRVGFSFDALQDSSLSNVSANTSLLCPFHYVLWVTRQSLGPNFGFNLARCFFTWKVVLSWSDSKGAAYNQFQHSLCTQVQFSTLRYVRVGQTSLARLQHRLIVWNLRCKNSSEQRHLFAKSFLILITLRYSETWPSGRKW